MVETFFLEFNLYIWLILTSGCGEPCPEHSMCPPVLLLNSTLCGGSWENTGPCKSNSNVSKQQKQKVERKKNANRHENINDDTKTFNYTI